MSSIPILNKPKQKRYFTQDTEDAIIEYNKSDNSIFKSRIYELKIHYAFFKLTENLIHTFKFYNTDVEDLTDLQHELIIFLLSKIHLFNHRKNIQDRLKKIIIKEFKEEYDLNFEEYVGDVDRVTQTQINDFLSMLKISDKCREKLSKLTPPKAFSYFGTIAKRWLIVYNKKNYTKKIDISPIEDIEQDEKFSNNIDLDIHTKEKLSYQEKLSNFVDLYSNYCYDNIEKIFPDEEEAKIADAILQLFRKRNTLSIFNKKALYIYIRDKVDVKTPKITKVADELEVIFTTTYIQYLDYGYIKF